MPLPEIALEPGLWALLVGLGGLLALDAVSFPQFMVSRPFVSATLGGALLGEAAGGMLVGAVLELLSMRHPPYGAARYPDTGPAGLVAGAAFAAVGTGSIQALVAALLGGWATGWTGTFAGHLRRRINGRLVVDAESLAGNPARLERRVFLAGALDLARGALVTAGFLLPVVLLTGLASGIPVTGYAGAFGAAVVVTALAASVGAGARTTAPDARAWAFVMLGALVAVGALWGLA